MATLLHPQGAGFSGGEGSEPRPARRARRVAFGCAGGVAIRVAAASRGVFTSALVVMLVCLGGAARAQNVAGFALDRFEPSGGGSDWFTLESLDLRGRVRPAVGLTGNWAWKPLSIYNPDGTERAVLVRHQVFTYLGAALNLWGRARVGVSVPVALYQSGESGTLGGLSYGAAREAGVGDIRATVDVRLFGTRADRLTMAAGWQVFFPSGSQQQYVGDSGFRVAPRLLMAGDTGSVAYAVRLGYRYRVQRPATDDAAGVFQGVGANSELTGGAGVGYRFAPAVIVGLELSATTVASGGHFLDRRSTPVELLAGAHFTVKNDWRIGAGIVPGLTDGIGAPALRGVVQLEYFPAFPSPVAPIAARPRDPPAPVAPSPPVAVAATASPSPPPTPPPPPPPPDVPPEPPSADKDADDITDAEDACPDHPGPRDLDPKKSGCPVVRIEAGQVRIVEQVKFKTNSAIILKQSNHVLDEVVKLLAGHTEIIKVRIEGHTDNRGKLKRNQKLSERRAASILKWFVKHGVAQARLTSVGFGAAKPIATNRTDEGRRENRRVEFHITDGS